MIRIESAQICLLKLENYLNFALHNPDADINIVLLWVQVINLTHILVRSGVFMYLCMPIGLFHKWSELNPHKSACWS